MLRQFGLWLAGATDAETRYAALAAAHADLARAHAALAESVGRVVDERDAAQAEFQAYAKQNLGVRPDLQARAHTLVREFEKKMRHHSGEFRRHQVYAELLKEFPSLRPRDLSLAIEMAVRACSA